MFKKILIANRGEIACRVIKTARKMGIKTVAVYSDADARALHVEMADEAYRLGPPPAAESYLLGEEIIRIARETGAEAVHPGYGFLSEREWFSKALEDAGIAFIGPGPHAIAAMGDKIESKKLAMESGVSVVPGFVGEISDTDHAVEIANGIGYPVMMKASAGGGGKGMRLAYSEKEVRDSFQSVRNEAKASFGDDRVFIEKFVEQPRHIEIQVLGDSHGNVIYLGERECSVQRRHQKVVEEAPSPFVTPEMRKAMGEQAVQLAKAVQYRSAGTVEFIAGADRSFYFLEMNTRLQVEHPVTEMITGLDLVEQMIRVAAGEKLSITQDDVKLNGWSVETRVYAEDPYRNFLPSIGRVSRLNPPADSVSEDGAIVRVDTGIVEGSEISMFYDPMIAKLITWGPTREAAIDKQIDALDRYELKGVGHNIDFLSAVMQHERFRSGNITTGFIAEEYPEGFEGAPANSDLKRDLVAVASVLAHIDAERATYIDGQLDGPLPIYADWAVRFDGKDYAVTVGGEDVTVDGENVAIYVPWTPGERLVVAEVSGRQIAIQVEKQRGAWKLTTRGASHQIRVLRPRTAELAEHMIEKIPPDMSRFLICPMPGLLTALNVKEGDKVEAGQALATIEAMKMENILRAEKSGVVKSTNAAAGESLAADQIILEFE